MGSILSPLCRISVAFIFFVFAAIAQSYVVAQTKEKAVDITVRAGEVIDGVQTFCVMLSIYDPWMVIAKEESTIGSEYKDIQLKMLVFAKGKPLDAVFTFPTGKPVKLGKGTVLCYVGDVSVKGTVRRNLEDGPITMVVICQPISGIRTYVRITKYFEIR